MMRYLFVLALLGLFGCNEGPQTAQEIVDQAIDFSGTEKLRNALVTFDFRTMSYAYWRENGTFKYSRTQKDSASSEIKDL